MTNKKRVFIAVFSIFTLGLLLRAQETLSRNFLFLLDQGRDMMAVKDIVYGHHLTLIGPNTSLQGVFQGPLWYYLLAISTILFNGDPWGALIMMLAISLLVLLAVYLLTKNVFSERVALVSLFLFALAPEAIAAATYVWNPHPMWLLIVIYIFSFYLLISKNRKFNLIVWFLIGLMFHFQTALAVFIFLSSLIYLIIFNRKIIINRYFFLGVALFVLTLLPQIAFDLRHDFLMSKSILSLFAGEKKGLFVGGENNGYLNLVKSHLTTFYINFQSSLLHIKYLKFLPNIFILIIIAAIFFKKLKIFDKKEEVFFLMLVRLISIVILLSFIYPFPIRSWFLTGFQSFYILLLGFIFGKILDCKIGKIVLYLFFLFLIINSMQRIYTLYVSPPDDGGFAKIKGKKEAIDYIYRKGEGTQFGLLVFTPPVYTYSYDYLLFWYGKRKYNYVPHQNKKGEFYLLIEPDRSKVWSYKGWLETVVKTGSVVFTEELPSGVIVQKRIN